MGAVAFALAVLLVGLSCFALGMSYGRGEALGGWGSEMAAIAAGLRDLARENEGLAREIACARRDRGSEAADGACCSLAEAADLLDGVEISAVDLDAGVVRMDFDAFNRAAESVREAADAQRRRERGRM